MTVPGIDHNVFHKTCPCKYIARNTGHMTHSLSHSYHNYMLETKWIQNRYNKTLYRSIFILNSNHNSKLIRCKILLFYSYSTPRFWSLLFWVAHLYSRRWPLFRSTHPDTADSWAPQCGSDTSGTPLSPCHSPQGLPHQYYPHRNMADRIHQLLLDPHSNQEHIYCKQKL